MILSFVNCYYCVINKKFEAIEEGKGQFVGAKVVPRVTRSSRGEPRVIDREDTTAIFQVSRILAAYNFNVSIERAD